MSVIIRKATKDDIPDLARIHVSGWQTSGHGIIDQAYLDALRASDRVLEWEKRFKEENPDVLLAFKGGECVGFINFGALQTPPPGTSKIRPAYSSEIYAIYLIPKVFRQGVGTILIRAAIAELQLNKHKSVCLWVLKGNKRGCAFYDKIGGQRIGKKDVEIGPSKVKELCYGWRDMKEILDK